MPDEVTRIGDLDIEQDLRTQRKVWIVQRVGWALMALTVGAALLGLFGGSGPLNQRTVGAPGSTLSIRYSPYGRVMAEQSLDVTLQPTAGRTRGRVWLGASFTNTMTLIGVAPEPSGKVMNVDGVTYTFEGLKAGKPITVTFTFRPTRPGSVTGRVGLTEGTSLPVKVFNFP